MATTKQSSKSDARPAVESIAGSEGPVLGAVSRGETASVQARDPTPELEYWRNAFATRSYARPDVTFAAYKGAYRYGWETWMERRDESRDFYEAEPALAHAWERRRRDSTLTWVEARQAVQDAWAHLEITLARCEAPFKEVTATILVLRDLLEVCRDLAKGFRMAAEAMTDQHTPLLRRFASESEGFAAQLRGELRSLSGAAEAEGGAGGSFYRVWMNVRGATPGEPRAMFERCVAGEQAAVEAFGAALKRPDLTPGARALITAQYNELKASHDRLTRLGRRSV